MKKLYCVLVFAAIAFAASSCSESNPEPASDSTKQYVTFSIKYVGPESRTVDENVAGTSRQPQFTSVTIVARGTGGLVTNLFNYDDTSADWSKITVDGLPVKIMVSTSARKIEVYANAKPVVGTTNINGYQTYDAVPLTGTELDIVGDNQNIGADGSEANPYSLTAQISPALARIEIYGGIPVNLTDHELYAVDIKQIYINNVYLTAPNYTSSTPTYFGSNLTLWDAAYSTTAPLGDFWNMSTRLLNSNNTLLLGGAWLTTTPANHNCGIAPDKVVAFNFYPQSTSATTSQEIAQAMPHIILGINVYHSEADYFATPMTGRNFITIKKFRHAGNYITSFQAGRIYRLNLNDLLADFENEQNPTDPNPEMDKINVEVNVEVLDWVVTDITPEL